MSYLKKIAGACAVAATLAAGNAAAAPITLNFEGIGDLHNVDQFYNGGTSSSGASGSNYGIGFGSSAYGLVDADVGGSGNTGNEPSGQTVLYFLDPNDPTIEVRNGFSGLLSFFHAGFGGATVSIYEGLNGTGELLASITLGSTLGTCSGDPTGEYCNFSKVDLAFDGLARSVVFGGELDYVVFDDMAFGAVPEPATFGLTALGLAGLIAARRKAAAKR